MNIVDSYVNLNPRIRDDLLTIFSDIECCEIFERWKKVRENCKNNTLLMYQ